VIAAVLTEIAEAVMAGAMASNMRRLTCSPRPVASTTLNARDLLQSLAESMVPVGWNCIAVERMATERAWEVAARHHCGAVCVIKLAEMGLIAAGPTVRALDAVFAQVQCYCVRRDVTDGTRPAVSR
jgi:hypothetical protein